MSFMQKQIFRGTMIEVWTHDGDWLVHPECFDPDNPLECCGNDGIAPEGYTGHQEREGWFCRLSAPGYLDCTDWSGPFTSEKEAGGYLEDHYDTQEEEQ